MKRGNAARRLFGMGAISAAVIAGAGFAFLAAEAKAAKPVPPLRTDIRAKEPAVAKKVPAPAGENRLNAEAKAAKPVPPPRTDSRAEEPAVAKEAPAPAGGNRYFVLKPGYELVLEGGSEKVVITVLGETMQIGETATQIVEEREAKNGETAEVSRSYFAISKKSGDVLYFGKDVQILKDGKIVANSGSWRAGEKDAKAGMMMPGAPSRGLKYSQENAPGKAMDRAEIVGTDETLKTPAGTFKGCLKIEETSALNPDEKSYKTYAPGIGLIQDGDMLLTRYGFVNK